VAFALAQLGKPYRLGATGPAAFDCSGLVQAAYASADVVLPRTTYSQVAAGVAVATDDPAALLPGDLVFIMGADPEGGLPGHVGMVVGPGQVIDAPYTGAVVRVTPLSTWVGQLVAVRRVAGTTT
jgi:cell wall-associated NlpC family hydrolase